MLKKGLVRTCIYEYLDANPNINTADAVMGNLKEIYEYLRKHPNHGDLLGSDCYLQFYEVAKHAFVKTQLSASSIFSELKNHFKMR